MGLHRTVIDAQENDDHHHGKSKQCVEVKGNRLHENADTVLPFYEAGHRRGPGRNRRDNADRSSRGVNQVSQLGTADVILVGHRTHNRTDSQTVEIVVDEDQTAQQHGRQLRAGPALDMGGRPLAERGGTTGTIHQLHHHTQNNQENQNAHVPFIGQNRQQPLLEHLVQSSHQIEACIQERAGQDSQEQGTVHLFGDQCQRDGNHRRRQCPGGLFYRHMVMDHRIRQPCQHQHYGYQ